MQNVIEHNHELPVRDLIVSRDKISPQVLVSKISDLFCSTSHLDALALVDDTIPVALITRSKLFATLSRRFGNELYSRDPIIVIADPAPLIVGEDDLLDSVIDKAFARSTENMYDEIIVTDAQGSYSGLLSVKKLVIEQSAALTRSIFLKEMATARTQELERINQAKAQFIANVTHELRSPVNAIIGLAELLKMAADKGATDQVNERLSMLTASATNLRAVITNILDMSKLETGKMVVASQPVDVGALLAEIAETTRILLRGKPVEVKVMIPEEPAMLMTDPIKLRQIMTNLTSNAAKFTDQGVIKISLAIVDERMLIEVIDTGTGIKEEDFNLIFTAFGQVEDAATKAHEGTGLGLTISKNLARLIGSSISVTSAYGKGSTFSLSLPLAQSNTQGVQDNAA